MDEHPSAEDLQTFVDQQLDEGLRAQIELHIDECAECRQVLSSLVADASVDVDQSTVLERTGALLEVPSRATPMALARGTKIDQYEIVGLIGHGGMGDVYQAIDQQLKRRVALKFIRDRLVDQPEAQDRLLREAATTAQFDHPNIVSVFGVGTYEGVPYVAMAYLTGEPLHRWLHRHQPSWSQAIEIAKQVAMALAEAHRFGVAHRDLKPANVNLDGDGRVRVYDFGLAKLSYNEDTTPNVLRVLDGDTNETTTRGLVGTPRYMSPEQWRMTRSGPPADIWAFGLMLFQMTEGWHPYGDGSRAEIMSLVASNDELSLEFTDDRAAQLIRRCLRKAPDQRPTAEAIVSELSELLQTPLPVAKDAPQTRRVPLWLIPVALVAAVASWFAWRAATMPDSSTVAVTGQADARAVVMPVVDAMVPDVAAADISVDAVAPADQSVDRRRRAPVAARRKHRRPRRRKPVPKVVTPATYGTVMVQSLGGGGTMWANVHVDGKYRGQTPITVRRLTSGKHVVEVRRDGFATQKRTILVRPDKVISVRFNLKKQ